MILSATPIFGNDTNYPASPPTSSQKETFRTLPSIGIIHYQNWRAFLSTSHCQKCFLQTTFTFFQGNLGPSPFERRCPNRNRAPPFSVFSLAAASTHEQPLRLEHQALTLGTFGHRRPRLTLGIAPHTRARSSNKTETVSHHVRETRSGSYPDYFAKNYHAT